MQLQGDGFSTIALRQGTVCGYSPRMRFDLIINTMFRCGLINGKITINNPSIWRPLLDVRDTCAAFLRAIQADPSINGPFNVAYDNFTVGQVGDIVREELMELTGKHIAIEVANQQDFRNYKVTCEKARTCLGFNPKYSVADTVRNLYQHLSEFGDFSDKRFYNIQVFKELEQRRAVK